MDDLNQLITRLKKHNQWRRGEIELTQEELNPKQIGLDIDDCISYLESIQSENRAPDVRIKPPEFISVNEGYYKD